MEESKNTKKIASALDTAGSITRSGIVSGARFLAQGIDKTSSFIKSHAAECEEPSEVSMLPGIEKASQATSHYIGGTHKLIGKAVNKTVTVASNAWNSMPESDLVKQVKKTETYQISAEIGKAGTSAGLNIIGGVSEGLNLVKDSSVKATIEIVEHRYGENAGKATHESLSIAGDMVGVYQMTHVLGLAGISAREMMAIQEAEEEAKRNEMSRLQEEEAQELLRSLQTKRLTE